MKFIATLFTALAATTSVVQSCLVLSGTYYNGGTYLNVVLEDNGVQLCSYHGAWTGKQAWLNCLPGHYAYLARSAGPEFLPQKVSYDAAYAHRGADYHFGVSASTKYVGNSNVAVGVNFRAENYC